MSSITDNTIYIVITNSTKRRRGGSIPGKRRRGGSITGKRRRGGSITGRRRRSSRHICNSYINITDILFYF
jgi:hypothetical protein